jgi:pyrroline-5-carboxylate reductase
MMNHLAVLGVGNMAKAILNGMARSDLALSRVILFDPNSDQYKNLPTASFEYSFAPSIADAVRDADTVLISVKPQQYSDVLAEIATVADFQNKLYISIGAGISVKSVTNALGGARVVRVLPNVPMLIGMGVSVICRNEAVDKNDFEDVCRVFAAAGSTVLIDESEMNRMIGVTSSSPAYVFQFIRALYDGAIEQGLPEGDALLHAICDMVIGSATMLKGSDDTPEQLIAKVASKGGTTERALLSLQADGFNRTIADAMKACTARADELGKQ